MRYPSPSGTLRRMDVSWIDHSWRERAEDGGWLYIREPYLLDGEAFADFAWLARGTGLGRQGRGLQRAALPRRDCRGLDHEAEGDMTPTSRPAGSADRPA